jgi:hypothetical protein
MSNKFLDATNLSPKDKFYHSKIVTVDDVPEDSVHEIKSTQPIQVRINGGPWQDVRPLD